MGVAKQLMIEQDEMEWEYAPVTFQCPICGNLSAGESELPQIVDDPEFELDTPVVIECDECGEDFQAEFQKSPTGSKIIFDDYPSIKVDCDPVQYEPSTDEWDEDYFYDRPSSPFSLFEHAYSELLTTINTHATNDGGSSMNRMFFTQSFSMFEAYLCDAYLNLVFLNDGHQKRFIHKHKDAKDLSLSLDELMSLGELKGSTIVKKKLTQAIKRNVFHDLQKVKSLYKTYDIELLPKSIDAKTLSEAINHRHHAVHRNGRDMEGVILNVYTKKYLLEIAAIMRTIAKNIDTSILQLTEDNQEEFQF